MTHPVLLFVATAQRAHALQRDHGPDVLRVRQILRCHADRASAIIVEMPQMGESAVLQAEFDRWMEWLPTRLVPGVGKRITFL